jgi:hypothetical protein
MIPQDRPSTNTEQSDPNNNRANASQVARELHWLEKLNIVGQMGLVIVGIVAASIYGCQLSEMKRTNELTQQALKGNNDALQSTLVKMQGQVDATNVLAGHAKDQASSAKQNADTAKATLQATIDNFHIEQRPWVAFDAKPSGAYKWKDARTWGFRFKIILRVHNFGRTPARDVQVGEPMTQVVEGYNFPPPDANIRDHACDAVLKNPAEDGAVLYPNIASGDIVKEVWIPGSQIKRESAQHSAITIVLAECITYLPTYAVSKPFKYVAVWTLGTDDEMGEAVPYVIVPVDDRDEKIVLLPSQWVGRDIR